MNRFLRIVIIIYCLITLSDCYIDKNESQAGSPLSNDKVLFVEDFSNSNSGWMQYVDNSGSSISYVAEGLRIFLNEPLSDLWTTPGKHFKNVWVETDVTVMGGPENNHFGIICRYQSNQSFYAFLISSDGYFGVVKFIEGKFIGIGKPSMQFNAVINKEKSLNHLRAVCQDDNLSLSVNGKLLEKVQDDLFRDGDVGLIAGTYELPGTDVFFDNFIVLEP
jgi:hypothetical protein